MKTKCFIKLPEYRLREQVQSWYDPALKILQELYQLRKAYLKASNRNENNAAVTHEEFRTEFAERCKSSKWMGAEVSKSLKRAGLIEFVGSGFLKPKDGGV